MKMLVYLVCFAVMVLSKVFAKQAGVLLGAIPTVLIYVGMVGIARGLCKILDKNTKISKYIVISIMVLMVIGLFFVGCNIEENRQYNVDSEVLEQINKNKENLNSNIQTAMSSLDSMKANDIKSLANVYVVYDKDKSIDTPYCKDVGTIEIAGTDKYKPYSTLNGVYQGNLTTYKFSQAEFKNYLKAQIKKGITKVTYHKYSDGASNGMGQDVFSASTVTADSLIEDDDKAYSKGILTLNTYTSSFCGLCFTNPEGWVLMSEDEIDEEFNSDTEQYVYELAAISETGLERVGLMIGKLPTKNFTVEQYMKAFANNNASAGISVISDKNTRIIAGETYNVINASVNDAASGVTVKSDYYIRKIGDRMIRIEAIYLPGNEANIESALNAFSKY